MLAVIGVSMKPGPIAFTRMPWADLECEHLRQHPDAAFETQDRRNPAGDPRRAGVDVHVSIPACRPRLCVAPRLGRHHHAGQVHVEHLLQYRLASSVPTRLRRGPSGPRAARRRSRRAHVRCRRATSASISRCAARPLPPLLAVSLDARSVRTNDAFGRAPPRPHPSPRRAFVESRRRCRRLLGEALRTCASDSARAARDRRRLALEPSCHLSSLSSNGGTLPASLDPLDDRHRPLVFAQVLLEARHPRCCARRARGCAAASPG